MTVRDLVIKLQEFPQDYPIAFNDSNLGPQIITPEQVAEGLICIRSARGGWFDVDGVILG